MPDLRFGIGSLMSTALPGRSRANRRWLTPWDPEVVLAEFADVLLAEEEAQSVPDWEIVGPQVAEEIGRQSGQLLAEVRDDYDRFEGLRAGAVRKYGTADPAVCVLFGAIAGYLSLSLALSLPGIGLTPFVVAVLLIALGLRWMVWRRRRASVLHSVAMAGQQWAEVLRDQVLRPFIVEKRNDEQRNPRLFDTFVGERAPPRLIEGTEPKRLVVTEAMMRIAAIALNIHSGSLGVSGPRGVGKSTILQFFGTDAGPEAGGDLRLVIPAPVDYQPLEFIIHLFGQLCEAVPHGPGDRSAIAEETRRHLEGLRYLRTYTTSWSASLTPRSILNLAGGQSRQRAEQPFTLPELVASYRAYSGQAAVGSRRRRARGHRDR